jgi:two-component system LytT family response regulator
MLKILIVDDEKGGRELVSNLLKLFCKNVTVVAEAESIEEAIVAIPVFNPDIITLDIKMQDGTGFDLLKKVEEFDFKVIFITASHDYITTANQFNSIDYILKPISSGHLTKAIEKAERAIKLGVSNLE